LTIEGFDLEIVNEMLENSDLGILEKTGLQESLKAAQDNPELLETMLAKIREALGL